MKNQDMPAMPMGNGGDGSYFTEHSLEGWVEHCKPAFGITKLEYASIHVLGEMFRYHAGANLDCEMAAKKSVKAAKALLKELENESN